ncbi:MAG TPA: DUF4097 family beta strand repeat-containing protein [Candidatus Angelobacter sp.]|jgi:hypothetical protein|nr:DUF4097 family beta strand repeat-containing protein [Candidatus Angelobacter sp.]
MPKRNKLAWVTIAAMAAAALAGCGVGPAAQGAFDRTFKVDGPLRLELMNGSGDTHIATGTIGEARIHGEFRVKGWSTEGGRQRVRELQQNPPVSQEGNLIRVGGSGFHRNMRDSSVDYTIVVPPNTEVYAQTGSGDVELMGVKGPAKITSGSGTVSASAIGGDVQVTAGSGEIHLSDIKGQAQLLSGSGNMDVKAVHGEMRVQSGSGVLKIVDPGDNVVASTGSGRITVTGASADLRLRASSGDITVEGNPGTSNYWELHSSSGNVTMHVPSTASFRFYARSGSGNINAGIPIVMEGTAGKHELRARIGDGQGRVEIATSSGNIDLR